MKKQNRIFYYSVCIVCLIEGIFGLDYINTLLFLIFFVLIRILDKVEDIFSLKNESRCKCENKQETDMFG